MGNFISVLKTNDFRCMFCAVQFLNFILTLLCFNSFISAMVTEWQPILERAANSAYHL